MNKAEKNTIYALGYVLGEKQEWLATAKRELDTAIALDSTDCADYWRDQITRTSGAIAALNEVAEMSVSNFKI